MTSSCGNAARKVLRLSGASFETYMLSTPHRMRKRMNEWRGMWCCRDQVLQDALCGSSKALLVCNLSPEAASASESLSSLHFASRAAAVELGRARKAADSPRAMPPSHFTCAS